METTGLIIGGLGLAALAFSMKRVKDGRFKEGFREAGQDFGLAAIGIALILIGNFFLKQ